MATKKPNGKKRQSPSTERLLALALVRVVECVRAIEKLGEPLQAVEMSEEASQRLTERTAAISEARKVLADHGYSELESIATRVVAINDQIQAAVSLGDGKALALLGPALERAKKGLPPIAKVERKTKLAATERKLKVAKAVQPILDAFDTVTFADPEGRIVTSIKADETGKALLCQFNDDKWVNINPKDLKPLDDSAKGPGAPSVQENLSDATVQAATT